MTAKTRKHPRPLRRLPDDGWRVELIADMREVSPLGIERAYCEWCNARLRYVHVLTHADWPSEVCAGRCCAAKVCRGYDAAGEERLLRRRISFPTLDSWRRSWNGNLTIDYHGCTVTIFPRETGGYAYAVRLPDGKPLFASADYDSVIDAQLAAWDAWQDATALAAAIR